MLSGSVFCHQTQKLCWDYFAVRTVSTFVQGSHTTLSSSGNVNIVEWLLSVPAPAVQLLLGSALTISFGLACRGYTFDRTAFNVLFQKVLGLGFTFRVYV